ncbi:hypothetical protein RI367_005863 [Sorochytrium milnesiophthora]
MTRKGFYILAMLMLAAQYSHALPIPGGKPEMKEVIVLPELNPAYANTTSNAHAKANVNTNANATVVPQNQEATANHDDAIQAADKTAEADAEKASGSENNNEPAETAEDESQGDEDGLFKGEPANYDDDNGVDQSGDLDQDDKDISTKTSAGNADGASTGQKGNSHAFPFQRGTGNVNVINRNDNRRNIKVNNVVNVNSHNVGTDGSSVNNGNGGGNANGNGGDGLDSTTAPAPFTWPANYRGIDKGDIPTIKQINLNLTQYTKQVQSSIRQWVTKVTITKETNTMVEAMRKVQTILESGVTDSTKLHDLRGCVETLSKTQWPTDMVLNGGGRNGGSSIGGSSIGGSSIGGSSIGGSGNGGSYGSSSGYGFGSGSGASAGGYSSSNGGYSSGGGYGTGSYNSGGSSNGGSYGTGSYNNGGGYSGSGVPTTPCQNQAQLLSTLNQICDDSQRQLELRKKYDSYSQVGSSSNQQSGSNGYSQVAGSSNGYSQVAGSSNQQSSYKVGNSNNQQSSYNSYSKVAGNYNQQSGYNSYSQTWEQVIQKIMWSVRNILRECMSFGGNGAPAVVSSPAYASY